LIPKLHGEAERWGVILLEEYRRRRWGRVDPTTWRRAESGRGSAVDVCRERVELELRGTWQLLVLAFWLNLCERKRGGFGTERT